LVFCILVRRRLGDALQILDLKRRDQSAFKELYLLVELSRRWRPTVQYLSLSDGQVEALGYQDHGVLHGLQHFGFCRLLPLLQRSNLSLQRCPLTLGILQRPSQPSNLSRILSVGLLQLGHSSRTELQLGSL